MFQHMAGGTRQQVDSWTAGERRNVFKTWQEMLPSEAICFNTGLQLRALPREVGRRLPCPAPSCRTPMSASGLNSRASRSHPPPASEVALVELRRRREHATPHHALARVCGGDVPRAARRAHHVWEHRSCRTVGSSHVLVLVAAARRAPAAAPREEAPHARLLLKHRGLELLRARLRVR